MIKRVLLWFLGVGVSLCLLLVLAFTLSPWPMVMVITHMFDEGARASEAALAKHVPAGIVTQRDRRYGDGPDEIFDISYPQGAAGPLPVIVWVHGGGWIAGDKGGVANYMKVLAGRGYVAVGLEYSTGYGSTYPQPVAQVNEALGFLVRHAAEFNIDPARLVLAGDSAGAQIVGQVALLTTDPAYADSLGIAPRLRPRQLSALLLLSGAYDPLAFDYEGDYGRYLKAVFWAYTGKKDFLEDERFRLASVTRHVDGRFPPSFISSGNGDALEPQARAFAKKLTNLGVVTETLFFPRDLSPPLPHEYQFNLDSEAGRRALERMLAFVESQWPAESAVAVQAAASGPG